MNKYRIGLYVVLLAALVIWTFTINSRPLGSAAFHKKILPPIVPVSQPADHIAEHNAHPLVPGGIQSVPQLRTIVAQDSMLAEAYAGFNFDKAKIVKMDGCVIGWLAIRSKRGAFYDPNAYLLCDESIITDGHSSIRGEDGGRISYYKPPVWSTLKASDLVQ